MVIREFLSLGIKELTNTFSTAPRLDAAVLLCHVLGCERACLALYSGQAVCDDTGRRYLALIKQCAKGMPVAYMTGKREFMSLEFNVSTDVLIPRPDTEALCEYVLERCKGKKLYIADLCCGSGCIGISLAVCLPQSHVTMADISPKALEVARGNALSHGVNDRTEFVQADLLESTINGAYDVVVCNPPYIESGVIPFLQKGVRDYEPHLALDGGSDGLVFYRRLAQIAPDMLKEGGLLAVEVGQKQADAVCVLFAEKFGEREIICDLAGIQRVVAAVKTAN